METKIRIKRGQLEKFLTTVYTASVKGEMFITTGSSNDVFPVNSSSVLLDGLDRNSFLFFSKENGQVICANRIAVGDGDPPVFASSVFNGTLYYDGLNRKFYILRDSGSGGNILAQNQESLIGEPEDGTYDDGLFTDFSPTTKVGTAIDRFNEVLKGLAPPPPPDLNNFARTNAGGGATALLTFYTGVHEANGYAGVLGVSSATYILAGVGFNQWFGFIQNNQFGNSGTGYVRSGIQISNSSPLTFILNEGVVQNGTAPNVNYSASAFRVPDSGTELYSVNVNDEIIDFIVVSKGQINQTINGVQLILSETRSGRFQSSGGEFPVFKHRTGSITIQGGKWRPGWNYARASLSSSLGTTATNFIDWVWDPSGSSAVTPITANAFTTQSAISGTGLKWLSGIPYFTGVAAANLSLTASNYYRNHYSSASTIVFSSTPGIWSTSTQNPPAPTNSSSLLILSATLPHQSSFKNRILNQSITINCAINHVTKTTLNVNIITPKILLDSVDATSTQRVENFTDENYRVPINNLPAGQNVAPASYPSSQSLTLNVELMTYDGKLMYPTNSLNGGNFAGAGIDLAAGTLPNYSGLMGNRKYVRYVRNNSGTSRSQNMALKLSGSNFEVIKATSAFNAANQIKARIKIPDHTGWRDIWEYAPGNTTGTTQFQDNVGCLQGARPGPVGTNGSATFNLNFVNQSFNDNEFLLIEIEANENWNGHLKRIEYIFA